MSWSELCNLTFNSISVIGIFIAIIIGLVISKITDLNREYGELKDFIENIETELLVKNEHFNKLINDNYEFYKKDNIGSILDVLYTGNDFIFIDSIPYIDEKMQKDYFDYVSVLKDKVIKLIEKNYSIDNCRIHLKIQEGSLDDIILQEIFRIWED